MLHELLFALSGHHGHIFSLNSGRFKVNDALPFFHPAEIGIINKLLEIATDVWTIQNFASRYRHCFTSLENEQEGNGSELKGLYLEALCDGLDDALAPYRHKLADVEKDILRSGGETELARVQNQIGPFQAVMRALRGLVDQVKMHRAHGCLILDLVYRASCSGVAQERVALQGLLFHCHKVFYKQLLAWILKGKLHDPYREFIIEDVSETTRDHDGAADENTCSNRFSSTQSLISAHSPEESGVANLQKSGSVNAFNCRGEFQLRVDRIPSHISVTVAEKIFFIGESVKIFETGIGGGQVSAARSVLKDQEVQLYSRLADLRDSKEFRVTDFERFVESVRETVSRHLHDLILEKFDFKQELQMVRDLFLLGRGELYQMFIEEADKCLRSSPTAATQHDVNESFANACRVTLPDSNEKFLRKVSIRLPLKTMVKIDPKVATRSGAAKPQSGWDCLSLQYNVPWPLHLILTPSCIEKYNEILKFLLRVRRTQHMLHETWSKQIKDKSVSRMCDSWQLRGHMMFVVDNLQHYLMVDALESQYATLSTELGQTKNFEEIRHAHDVFLNSIVSFTFVHNDMVSNCLSELLSVCQKFCYGECQEKAAKEEGSLSELALVFSSHSDLLFRLLTSIHSRTTGSQLAQLLLRIDYNRYFSKHGHVIVKKDG